MPASSPAFARDRKMRNSHATINAPWIPIAVLSLIGIAAVAQRLLALASHRSSGLDTGFARDPVLTTLHIIPGLILILLGPLQFLPDLRRRHPSLHRWSGRIFVAAGLIVGGTALVMGPHMAIGGVNETAATTFFALVFLYDLLQAFARIRRRDIAGHREWMIRTYSIGLAVTTIRPIVGVFFATRRLSGLTPHEFFGTAFWIGFTMHLIAAEVWIHRTRPAQLQRHTAVDQEFAADRERGFVGR
jgi:uncharacterized membrane protein